MPRQTPRYASMAWEQDNPPKEGLGIKDRKLQKMHTARKRPHREDYAVLHWAQLAWWMNERADGYPVPDPLKRFDNGHGIEYFGGPPRD